MNSKISLLIITLKMSDEVLSDEEYNENLEELDSVKEQLNILIREILTLTPETGTVNYLRSAFSQLEKIQKTLDAITHNYMRIASKYNEHISATYPEGTTERRYSKDDKYILKNILNLRDRINTYTTAAQKYIDRIAKKLRLRGASLYGRRLLSRSAVSEPTYDSDEEPFDESTGGRRKLRRHTRKGRRRSHKTRRHTTKKRHRR